MSLHKDLETSHVLYITSLGVISLLREHHDLSLFPLYEEHLFLTGL